MKHLYRIIILLLIFIGSLFFFGRNIKEVDIELQKTVEMGEASFPTATLMTQEQEVNLLHGYASNISAVSVRETITPLDSAKTMILSVQEKESEIKKVKYELRSVAGDELIENGTVTALDKTKEGKQTKIKIKEELEEGTEYAMQFTLTTSMGKKIHYYTRIKYYEVDTNLKEKMDFISNFHKLEFEKEKASSLAAYMEPDLTEEDTSLACVTIHSSVDLLAFGKLKVAELTKPVAAIREYNEETATVELSYYLAADAGSAKPETYLVKEFFRVRYGTDQMYLLDYRRTMEAQFDIELASVKKNELKLGISAETDIPVIAGSDNNRMCFVRQGALWYYNLIENKAVCVFSFQKEDMNNAVVSDKKGNLKIQDTSYDYERNNYDQHNIRVLNMDDDGNIDFIVYGYMNRGDYEGKVGIALYHFYAGKEQIEEEVYVPVEKTYQYLKEDLDNFGYVNKKNVFYFSINHVIYRYSIVAKRLETVASGVTEDAFQMVEEGNYIVWQNGTLGEGAESLTLLDLETEKTQEIKAGQGEVVLLLGTINKNFIYGYAKKEDITNTIDGGRLVPMYQVKICDKGGKSLKEYEKEGYYITGVEVKENIITLDRAVRSGRQYKPALPDNIINKEETTEEKIIITPRITELAMTELYLTLPGGFEMGEKPKVSVTVHMILDEDTTLRITGDEKPTEKYYAYVYGEVAGSYEKAGEAIAAADVGMGTVTHGNTVIWERGNRLIRNKIETIPIQTGADSVAACIRMLLNYTRNNMTAQEASNKEESIYDILSENMDKEPLNLTGTTLEELFYFISDSRPVIAMISSSEAVLLTGYDELYAYMINPQTGILQRMDLEDAQTLFESAGSVFLSYER